MNRFSTDDIVRYQDGVKSYVIHKVDAFVYRDKNIEHRKITYDLIPKNVHQRSAKNPDLDINSFVIKNIHEDKLILISRAD